MKTCEFLYKLVQRKDGKLILWAEADDPIKFRDILQFQIDSAYPEGLKDFYVFECKVEDFISYCENNLIRKRTFEERINNE